MDPSGNPGGHDGLSRPALARMLDHDPRMRTPGFPGFLAGFLGFLDGVIIVERSCIVEPYENLVIWLQT
jgi:hypothetical protein